MPRYRRPVRLSIEVLCVASLFAASCGPKEEEPDKGIKDELYVENRNLWPLGHVPVCWDTDGFADEKGWVKSAIDNSWPQAANLSFTGWERCQRGSRGVRITLQDEMVVRRGLGRLADGRSLMELDVREDMEEEWSQCTENDLGRRNCLKALAIHEFGHSLGFAHEQNRPDTPELPGWLGGCDREPQGSDGNQTIGDWDRSSIMNYCADADELSNGDKRGVAAVYGKPVYYNAVFRRLNVEETSQFGADYDQHRNRVNALWDAGWRIHQMATYDKNGATRRDTVWRKTNAPEFRLYGWTYDAYREKYNEIWPNGWRLYILNPLVRNGVVRYDAIFHRTGGAEFQVYGVREAAFVTRDNELGRQTYRPYIINTYFVNGEKLYDAVWKPSGAGEIRLYGATYQQYRDEYDRLWADGFRLNLIGSYVDNGTQRYNATWRRSDAGEFQVHGVQYGHMKERYDELFADGLRLHSLNAFQAP